MSATIQRLQSIFDILYSDIDKCLIHNLLLAEQLSEVDKQFWRRAYVRSLFAFIEGVVYNMKQVALENWENTGVGLTNGEIVILQEKSFDIDDAGALRQIDVRLSIRRNIKFAFAILAKSRDKQYRLDVSNAKWDAFLKILKVRDRLMHPKQDEDLLITDIEFDLATKAQGWFIDNFTECLSIINSQSSRVQ